MIEMRARMLVDSDMAIMRARAELSDGFSLVMLRPIGARTSGGDRFNVKGAAQSDTVGETIATPSVNHAPTVTISPPDVGYGPVGGEILVNTATAGGQIISRIATLANGGFAITWDGSAFTMNAQVFA